MRWLLAVAVAVAMCASCAPMRVSAPDIVEDGRSDILAALNRYKGERLLVLGALVHKDRVNVKDESYTGAIAGWYVSMRKRTRRFTLPLLVLDPGVQAYFDPDQIDEVAHLKIGDFLGLACTLVDYRKNKRGELVPLMADCSVKCVGDCPLVR